MILVGSAHGSALESADYTADLCRDFYQTSISKSFIPTADQSKEDRQCANRSRALDGYS